MNAAQQHFAIAIATKFSAVNTNAKFAARAIKEVTHETPAHLMTAEEKEILNKALAALDQILDRSNSYSAEKSFNRLSE